MIKRDTLIKTAGRILELASHYRGAPQREMLLDGLVYGYLDAKFGVSRQHRVPSNTSKPKRIDFRNGGSNPALIELVVRTEGHRVEAYATQNRAELHKLERQYRAKARYLLILDVSSTPLLRPTLVESYSRVARGRGRFRRSRVRIIYVHKETSFHFLWPVRSAKKGA